MSIIKSIKQVLGLGPAAENHFWDGSVANQLSLKRGTPDAPGAELIKAVNGVLSFPNQGQSLAANGYVKLPGGLIIQWGISGAAPAIAVTFPIPFPTALLAVVASPAAGSTNTTSTVGAQSVNGFTVSTYTANTAAGVAYSNFWIAIGY